MEALTLFNQNFSITEHLLQLYQLFHGLKKVELKEKLRIAVCAFWNAPENTALEPAINDRAILLTKSAIPVPENLTKDGGLDFLLRQAVIVACTSLESFFWDSLRANVLTIVKAKKGGADDSLRSLIFTLGDYISMQEYGDPDLRLRQIILKNFERGTLYNSEAIEKIIGILTIKKKDFWGWIEYSTGEKQETFKKNIDELVHRRNQIAHRADRPDEGEEADAYGLRPISYSWTHHRVQSAKTFVTASAELITKTIMRLEKEIQTAEEQEQARQLLQQISEEVEQK